MQAAPSMNAPSQRWADLQGLLLRLHSLGLEVLEMRQAPDGSQLQPGVPQARERD